MRQVDVRRLFRVREPESLMWGLEENTVLPTTGNPCVLISGDMEQQVFLPVKTLVNGTIPNVLSE